MLKIYSLEKPSNLKPLKVIAKEMIAALKYFVEEPKILLSFDESHPLTELCDDNGWSSHLSIRNAMRSIFDQNVFLVFSSTTGKLPRFIPARDPSRKMLEGSLTHSAPICGVGYDLLASEWVEEDRYFVADYSSIKNMAKFGRPL